MSTRGLPAARRGRRFLGVVREQPFFRPRGVAIAFIAPIALVVVGAALARLQSYAVIALAIGALLVSGALFLGLLMWAGAHGAFS